MSQAIAAAWELKKTLICSIDRHIIFDRQELRCLNLASHFEVPNSRGDFQSILRGVAAGEYISCQTLKRIARELSLLVAGEKDYIDYCVDRGASCCAGRDSQ